MNIVSLSKDIFVTDHSFKKMGFAETTASTQVTSIQWHYKFFINFTNYVSLVYNTTVPQFILVPICKNLVFSVYCAQITHWYLRSISISYISLYLK